MIREHALRRLTPADRAAQWLAQVLCVSERTAPSLSPRPSCAPRCAAPLMHGCHARVAFRRHNQCQQHWPPPVAAPSRKGAKAFCGGVMDCDVSAGGRGQLVRQPHPMLH
eukprot:222850-Chlamydomonas_euryale.AAC.8